MTDERVMELAQDIARAISDALVPLLGPERLLTVPEVADRLRVSPRKAYEIVRQRGEIPHVMVDGQLRVQRASLEAYIVARSSR